MPARRWRSSLPPARTALLIGGTSSFCPFAIVALAVPIGGGAFWALKALAPTRLALTGAVAGLTAGALAAFIYAFSCGEIGIAFLATWYSSGILASGAIGALLGRRLLRW